MSRAYRIWWIVILVGSIGILFNFVQIIIILEGGYNQNPAIESPILAQLDSILPTVVWLMINIVIFGFAVMKIRQSRLSN